MVLADPATHPFQSNDPYVMENGPQDLVTIEMFPQKLQDGPTLAAIMAMRRVSSATPSMGSSSKTVESSMQSGSSLLRSSSGTSLTTLSDPGDLDPDPDGAQRPLAEAGEHLASKDDEIEVSDDYLEAPSMIASTQMRVTLQPLVEKARGLPAGDFRPTKSFGSYSEEPLGPILDLKINTPILTDASNLICFETSQFLVGVLVLELLFVFLVGLSSLEVERLFICLMAVHLVSSKAQIDYQAYALHLLSTSPRARDIRLKTSLVTQYYAVLDNAAYKALFVLPIMFFNLTLIFLIRLSLPLSFSAILPLPHVIVVVGEIYVRFLPKVWIMPLCINDRLLECKVDTGSHVNLMAFHVACLLGLEIDRRKASRRRRPDGTDYWTLGTVDVLIRFPGDGQNEAYSETFHVISQSAYDLSVGITFLDAHHLGRRVNNSRSVQRYRHLWEIGQCLLGMTLSVSGNNTFSFLPITIGLCKLDVLVDTGAQVNAVSARTALEILRTVGFPMATISQHTTAVRYVDRKGFTARYILELELRFGSKQVRQQFVVIPHLIPELLVGVDFCALYENSPDYKLEPKLLAVKGGTGPIDAPLTKLGPVGSIFTRIKEKGSRMVAAHRHPLDPALAPTPVALKQEAKQAHDSWMALHSEYHKALSRTPENRLPEEVKASYATRLQVAKATAHEKEQRWQDSQNGWGPTLVQPELHPVAEAAGTAGPDIAETTEVAGALPVDGRELMAAPDQPLPEGMHAQEPGTLEDGAAPGVGDQAAQARDEHPPLGHDQTQANGNNEGPAPITTTLETGNGPTLPEAGATAPINNQMVEVEDEPVNPMVAAVSAHPDNSAAHLEASIDPADAEASEVTNGSSRQRGPENESGHLLIPIDDGGPPADSSSGGPSSIMNEGAQPTPRSSVSPIASLHGGSESDELRVATTSTRGSAEPVNGVNPTPLSTQLNGHNALKAEMLSAPQQ